MKRNNWMALIVTSFMMFAVCLSASAKTKKIVERGMTKQEVIEIMGQPKLTSFDAYGDRWEFYKMNALTGESKRIVVGFDLNGKVVAYNMSYVDDNIQQPAPPSHPSCGSGVVAVVGPEVPIGYGHCLDDASFSILYNKVKNATFDDNKFDLLQVASLGCYYSCAQAVSMMNIFTFGDSKMKALRLMAPHIIDLQNATIIYQQFSFESEKQKVGEILRSSRISPQNLHIQ